MDLRPRLKSSYSNLNSPGTLSNGRTSPFKPIKVKGEVSRSNSPSITRQPGVLKRPPSAMRMHETSVRAPSPMIDNRRYTPSNDFRPTSSMSNRSNTTTATASGKAAANTTVSIRIRPAPSDSVHQPWIYDGQDDRISSSSGGLGPPLDFSFDHVFTETANNRNVYEESVKHLIKGVVDGFHGTVFAYGMTGTGKTFSMQGTPRDPGIIPLAVKDLFSLIAQDMENSYLLKASYLEIYNERIRDLLNESLEETDEIKIRDDPRRGLHAYPLSEICIESEAAFLAVMAKGDALRHQAATDFNAHSSRSHAVIQIVIESSSRAAMSRIGTPARVSTLNLIDLAGSEKAAADAERRKEGSYINKSLLTLGTVIAKLTSSNSSNSIAHIPFRDSKLTRLLQHALSGLSLVSILATINTGQAYITETTNTLKFASRAKFIPAKAQKAELYGGNPAALIESLRAEVQSLRLQLATSQALIASLQNSNAATQNGNHAHALNDIRENDTSSPYTPQPLRYVNGSSASVHDEGGGARESRANSPPGSGNFSYPLNFVDARARSPPEVKTPLRYDENKDEEQADRVNAMADKELASSVLSKSQRSREEARNLTIQIAQLKSREDKRAQTAKQFKAFDKIMPDYHVGTNSSSDESTGIRGKNMTLISPNIRAPPREGFI